MLLISLFYSDVAYMPDTNVQDHLPGRNITVTKSVHYCTTSIWLVGFTSLQMSVGVKRKRVERYHSAY